MQAKDATGFEDWLVEGGDDKPPNSRRSKRKRSSAAPPGRRQRAGGRQRSEWLPRSKRSTPARQESNGRNGQGSEQGPAPPDEPARRWPGGKRARFYRERSRELELRVEQLEAELRAEKKKARSQTAKLRAQLRGGRAPTPDRQLDANTATFEQLRAAGLSLTQSANLIRRRESNGGFRSNAELKRIPGLSQAAKRTVAKRLRVRRR